MDLLFLLHLLILLVSQNVAVLGQLEGSWLTLAPSTPSITHFVNDSFIIFCKTVQKDANAKWKDPKGVPKENTKGRVHIEKKTGFLALVFEHIALTDKGNWTCEATLTNNNNNNEATSAASTPDAGSTATLASGEARKSFELLVNQKISFDKTELVQSAGEGRDATVKCFVKGDPRPDVSWLYNGEYINTVNSTKYKKLSDGLFIKNVQQSDAGEYTCRAMRITPTFADSEQITILLRIQHKPHWFDNDTSLVQYAYIGGMVNISCDAMGEPPPSFTWVHEGRAITGRNYRIFYADYGSTLQIHVRNESQLGDYKCKVANPLGMLERIVKLRKGQKPSGPTRFQLLRAFTDGFDLDIRSVKYSNVEDNMHTYGYRVQYMSEGDFKHSAGNWSYAKHKDFHLQRGGRFVLDGLDRNTTYLVRAATRNLAGLSDWSTVKIFATLTNFARRTVTNIIWQTCLVVGLGYSLSEYVKFCAYV
ncbi:neural cell adhesion molecule 1-A [Bactrocera dorsalis]|uniref:Neural cell adhesion molecule 1-A n=1 Tax=Bactrocera dorsalis TaxID=27457 RepID=A0ABM3J043_BACDO|nr:neural cell adhesion molecule 1-A [Bactrocera dorsalis]